METNNLGLYEAANEHDPCGVGMVVNIHGNKSHELVDSALKVLENMRHRGAEGADEVFGGYLYFHKAPDVKAFHEETVRKLSKLYLYDCLRANKSLSAWGVEGRVPFLDKEFLDVAMRLAPSRKCVRAIPSRKKSCAKPLPICFPTMWLGDKKSSSAMA